MIIGFLICSIYIVVVSKIQCLNVVRTGSNSGIQILSTNSNYRKNQVKNYNKISQKQICKLKLWGIRKIKARIGQFAYVSTTLKGINLGYKITEPNSPENVMIVDGTGLAYRCFFALPDLKTSKGIDIGCLMGFMNSLARLHRMFNPKYMGVVFDSPGANDQKRDIWPEYKLNRQVVSTSFRNQLGWIREFCAILGLPVFIERSTEADDIITSMINFIREVSSENSKKLKDYEYLEEINFAKNTIGGIFDRCSGNLKDGSDQSTLISNVVGTSDGARAEGDNMDSIRLGYDVTVVTADKDLLQILAQNGTSKVTVKIVQPHKSYRIVNQHTVKKEYGIDPERFSEYLALVGDSADNIPGIMGIGPKTAPKLIEKYKTFDDILTSEEINTLTKKGGKYSESVKMAHEFHSIVKLKKNLRVLTSMDQLIKSSPLSCQLAKFLKMFSLQKASSKWSMFTK
ncbi:5'-3' exonuclease [Theileria orientalis]|uniref:5'-3' exonuclease n=1 Tax=Theileria orientalis TaxID=68886 RepID=A0A976QTQ3_THEOR|nr:5'-3' exonuclease [Theileria orientalis]